MAGEPCAGSLPLHDTRRRLHRAGAAVSCISFVLPVCRFFFVVRVLSLISSPLLPQISWSNFTGLAAGALQVAGPGNPLTIEHCHFTMASVVTAGSGAAACLFPPGPSWGFPPPHSRSFRHFLFFHPTAVEATVLSAALESSSFEGMTSWPATSSPSQGAAVSLTLSSTVQVWVLSFFFHSAAISHKSVRVSSPPLLLLLSCHRSPTPRSGVSPAAAGPCKAMHRS